MIETAIRLPAAKRLGAHPSLVFGRFNDIGELTYVLASDGRNCRTWSRERREDAEIFEARIVRDLAERANIPHAGLAAE